ncbi:MAG: hypothetical protein ACJ73D_11520 [Pyrinomonadaceae bacterium]
MAPIQIDRFSIVTGVIAVTLLAIAGYLTICNIQDRQYQKQNTADYMAKGAAFGQVSDQPGCIQEGMLRARATTAVAANYDGLTAYFVDSCLRSSRPTPDFCELVPSSDVAAWENVQCEKAGPDISQTVCLAVLDTQVKYCQRNNGNN